MGLDMYLTAKRYYSKWLGDKEIPSIEEIPEGFELQTITVEAAYWRKANQIHAWFVDNVQDGEDECRPHGVPREKLQELRDLCQQAFVRKDASLLEPRSGFFFGSTEIDDWYWEGLKNTVEMLDNILSKFSDKWDFEYQSSW